MATLEDTIFGKIEGNSSDGEREDVVQETQLENIDIGEEAFLEAWKKKELELMKTQLSSHLNAPKLEDTQFSLTNELIELTKDTYVSAIDNNSPNKMLIIHVYGDNAACRLVEQHLKILSQSYSHITFSQVNATEVGKCIYCKTIYPIISMTKRQNSDQHADSNPHYYMNATCLS